jgi:hypothetical protein
MPAALPGSRLTIVKNPCICPSKTFSRTERVELVDMAGDPTTSVQIQDDGGRVL